MSPDSTWWRGGVVYQIYPRSFQDSNGDGIGDLPGIVDRLDYLEWLGVDGIWLNPTMPSPNADWGYDVSDYLGVHPDYGTPDDLDRLVREAGARGIRVLLDLVPNHTSDRHAWFVEARSSRAAWRRDWYVWAGGSGDSLPNNWMSVFGGPAWEWDEATGEYYLHNFLPSQPDLDWWNDEVRNAFDHILRHWFDRGVAGFRIDVAHGLVKDRKLRDNPPAAPGDNPNWRRVGQRPVYNLNRPEVHEVYKRWRAICDAYDPPRILLGETWVLDLAAVASYYGTGDDELHMAFNFPFIYAGLDGGELRRIVEETESLIPPGGWPVWTLSNHDVIRFPTRWAGGDEAKVRCALLLLLCLRGTAVLYYGDELGMEHVEIPRDEVLDPVSKHFWPERGRDGARTPMQWSAEPGAGFTEAGVRPWLRFGDAQARNVRDQRGDAGSVLRFVRDLVALRRAEADLAGGGYARLEAPPDVWAWRRGERLVACVNLGDEPRCVRGLDGAVLIGTDRARDGEAVRGQAELGPWEGLLLEAR